MTHQLTVEATPEARALGAIDVVVSSLPVSLTPSAGTGGHLVAVAGTGAWWEHLSAPDAATLGFLVVDPRPLSTHIPSPRRPVVLDRGISASPGLDRLTQAFDTLATGALLEVHTTVRNETELVPTLLDLLGLVRATTGRPLISGRIVRRSAAGLITRGELTDGRPVLLHLTVTHAGSGETTVRAVGVDRAVHASIPRAGAARPVELRIATAGDEARLPTHYETGHRAAWRRLHDCAITGETTTDVADFAEDSQTLATLLSTAPSD